MDKTSSRYPYTYACDFLRARVDDYDEHLKCRVPTISRSQASLAIGAIALVMDMSHQELAEKLADAYMAQEVK